MTAKRRRRLTPEAGQSLMEFGLVLPLLLLFLLGAIELSYLLLDQHIVTKLSREGSNMISRDITLQDTATAMRSMATRPVDFNSNARLILSVLKKGGTVGTPNYDQVILYQRHEIGAIAATSTIQTAGAGSFGGYPNYEAVNSDTDTNLRVTNLPANIITSPGGLIYITEVFTQHQSVTAVGNIGLQMPTMLHSIAYF